ncbi:MAG: glycosyl hydrolase [Cyclobacteriaceae bacterium]
MLNLRALGDTWEQLTKGLPTSNMGKIGLAISPQNPDVLYAAIELDRRTGGVYKSTDRGASWQKMSDTVSGATGPHYYQELYASPHQFDKLYLMDVRIQISEDGGKTFRQMNEEYKHSDNHAIAFKESDPDYVLIGTDGGIYESYDGERNWRFINNFPIAQYYKVAVDDAAPFYNIYGGTQDTNTHGGPSRTDNMSGITNGDWYITVFADGHQPATEPGNPNIVYSEWQQGNLVRTDRTTGEFVYIQPQPEKGEAYERFNWDAPILVSPHNPKRLYFASQRVWKSDNRGDSWQAISDDLTRNEERFSLPIMGGQQSIDNAWDVLAMSNYNTITSLAESPKQEGLLYAGTDAGIIQVSENGGDIWRKVTVNAIPGVPSTAFVNDIKADLYDANKVYVLLDNHKYGDFKPYLYMSADKGRTWQSMRANLPDKLLTWRIVQDHKEEDLFFLATEFGIYFTVDGGQRWTKFKGGLPTISFRDLAIQKRENDLVAASFGRSFYVLDDYSFLRDVSSEVLDKDGALFSVRDAWWYKQRPVVGYSEKGNMGAAYYTAKNPDFGATFTYYLKEDLKTSKETRKEQEKESVKAGKQVGFAGWDRMLSEEQEESPKVWLTVSDANGQIIRRLSGATKKGIHRLAWDLTYPPVTPVRLQASANVSDASGSVMVAPGKYSVSLYKEVDGKVTQLAEPVMFNVKPLREGALKGKSAEDVAEFWNGINEFNKKASVLSLQMQNGKQRLQAMKRALAFSQTAPGNLDEQLNDAIKALNKLDVALNGDPVKNQVGEKNDPGISDRVNAATNGTFFSTYGPTPTHERSMEIAKEEFSEISQQAYDILNNKIPSLEKDLQKAGAPWVEGQQTRGR